MQSLANDVDHYMQDVPSERRAVLQQLRELCLATLTGYEESMVYGMPSYARGGEVEVAFASQKKYISLYILKKPVLDHHRQALKGISLGKGCIRYTKPEKVDFAIVQQLLVDTTASDTEIC
jgi:uncharacterized protein YdhG (YjbR/CyaY superfamily)